jgi:hypothetical protein
MKFSKLTTDQQRQVIIQSVLSGRVNAVVIAQHITEHAAKLSQRYDVVRDSIRQECKQIIDNVLI